MAKSPAPALRYAGLIHPATLLEQVQATVPWLLPPMVGPGEAGGPAALVAACGSGPRGYEEVLRLAALEGGLSTRWRRPESPPPWGRASYFALCLAAHYATVASFCPTDVDTKIRAHAWAPSTVEEAFGPQLEALRAALAWDPCPVSTRWVGLPGHRAVSGHEGELLSVVMGAAGGLLHRGRVEEAQAFLAWAEAELEREAAAFREASAPGLELEALALASILAHNAGDVDQGMQAWPQGQAAQAARARLGRLAHQGGSPLAKAFQAAKGLYQLVAAEGHRHYPLRGLKALRRGPELLLPIGPCFDAWGAEVARSPLLGEEERLEVLGTLILGTKKVPGQEGYARAVAGFLAARDCSLESLLKELPPAARPLAKEASFKKAVSLPRASFESSLRKRVRARLLELGAWS